MKLSAISSPNGARKNSTKNAIGPSIRNAALADVNRISSPPCARPDASILKQARGILVPVHPDRGTRRELIHLAAAARLGGDLLSVGKYEVEPVGGSDECFVLQHARQGDVIGARRAPEPYAFRPHHQRHLPRPIRRQAI